MAAITTTNVDVVDVESRADVAEPIPSHGNDECIEPLTPAATTETSAAARESNAIELDRPDVEYDESQSIGLENSGGLFWICNAFAVYGRQMDASSSGIVLLLSHGLQFIWALNTMRRHHDQQEHLTILGKMALLIYYVGAIGGTLAAAVLLPLIKKRIIYNIGVGLCLLTAILFMLAEWHPDTLIPGRVTAGISHGLVYYTTLVHTSETASKEFRHFVVLNIGFTFGISILVVSVISLSSYNANGLQANTAITTLIYAIIGLINNYVYTQESPIYLLQQQRLRDGDDTEINGTAAIEAYETFRVLQRQRMSCLESQRRFAELKAYVSNEHRLSGNILADGNQHVIVLATCIRLATVLSFNLGLVFLTISMEQLVFSADEAQMLRISFLAWFVCGTLTIFVTYRRRNCLYLCALAFGIVSTANLIILIIGTKRFIELFVYVLAAMLGAYVLCVSLPLDILGGIFLSEAFPLSKKRWSIAIALCLESVAHLILIWFVVEQMYLSFWFVTSLSLIGLGFKLAWSVPQDTHRMTLQESAAAFVGASAREWYTRANVNSRCT